MQLVVFVSLLTVTCFSISSSSRPKCPNPKSLKPCTCDLEGISCNWAIDGEDLRLALKVYDGSSEYRGFWMVESSVKEIQNGTFIHNTFRDLYFPNNKIETIQPDAFRGLEKTAKVLDLQNNELRSIPLVALEKLEFLQELVLAKNKISAVPEKAFTMFKSLHEIRLEGNQISYVGRMAFDMSSLHRLVLSANHLKTIGDLAFAVSNPADATRLILELNDNEIEKISSTALDGREDGLGSVSLKNNGILSFEEDMFGQILHIMNGSAGVELDLSGNLVMCDKSMEWILRYPVSKLENIHGVVCLKNGVIVDSL